MVLSEIEICGNTLQEKVNNLGHTAEFGKHSEGKDSLYDMVCMIEPLPETSVEDSLKDDADCVGLTLQKYLLSKSIDAAYGRKSLGKDDIYTLIEKIPVETNPNFVWDSRISSQLLSYGNTIRIGTGGGKLNYGDGTGSTTVSAGFTSLNHTYSNPTKKYEITLENVVSIGNSCFNGCKALTKLDLPNATSVGIESFNRCSNLKEVDIPSVNTVARSAFKNCTSLESIELSNTYSIAGSSFYGCTGLKSVEMPVISTINVDAFKGCSSLESIKFALTVPPVVSDSNAWYGIPSTCKILVPAGYKDIYKYASNMPNPSIYTYEEY